MSYNLLEVQGIDIKSWSLVLSTSVADVIPALGANEAVEVGSATLSNKHATLAIDVTIILRRAGPTEFTLLGTVTIPAKSTRTVACLANLGTGESIRALASAANDLTVTLNGKHYR